MEGFLFALLLVIVIIRWVYLRDRFNAIERRLAVVERASVDWARAWHPPGASGPPLRPTTTPVRTVRTPPAPDVAREAQAPVAPPERPDAPIDAPPVTPVDRPATDRPVGAMEHVPPIEDVSPVAPFGPPAHATGALPIETHEGPAVKPAL